MATENVGAIQYTVDADTAAMIKAEATVNKSIASQVKAFDKADQAVRDFMTTQKDLGRTINSMGQVMDKNGKIVHNSTIQYRRLAATAQDGFGKLNTQVGGVAATMRGARVDMGNFSYQLQDIAVQAQMGVNPLIIMSQQIPQMLVGMGAAAAAIGGVIAVVGLLATSLIDTTSNIDRMSQAIDTAKAIMTVGADGVREYTEEMRKLNELSASLAELNLAVSLSKTNKAIKDSRDEAKSLIGDMVNLFDGLSERIIGTTERLSGLEFGDEGFQAAKKNITDLQRSLLDFNKYAGDTASQKKYLDSIESMVLAMRNAKGEFPTDDAREFAEQVLEWATKTRQLIQVQEAQAKALKGVKEGTEDLSGKTDEATKTYESMSQSLKIQSVELKDGERAAYEYSLRLKDLTDEQVANLMALYDSNKAQEENNRQKEEAARKEERLAEAIKKRKEAESRKEEREQEREQQQGVSFAQGIISRGMSESERFEEDMTRLELLRETDLENRELYNQAIIELDQQRAEKLNAQTEESTNFMLEAFEGLENQIAGTMAQVAIGAQDGEDAMKSLGRAILNEVVGSLIMQGIELVKNKVLGDTLAKSEQANIVSTTTTGVTATNTATAATTSAAATTAAASAPAAALTSTFSFGGAAVAGLAALAAIFAASKLMGGREFGGPVTAGNMYRVGERGPEIFTQNGKNYMIPGQNGQVTSNKDAFGGSGWNINVNNNGPDRAYVTIDEVNQAVNVQIGAEAGKLSKGRGKFASAMRQSSNTRFNGAN